MSGERLGGHAAPLCGDGAFRFRSKIVECVPSRRSTAMSALGGFSRLIHEYQSDSSSKMPLSSLLLGSSMLTDEKCEAI